ncbi:MAG TPA: hypothetical protein DEF41_02625 [Desulfovibrio sp.]|uniref:Uncharacterized protein n=2 Tax=Nitratidesulfovibrio vulgaris TaxID=881 RepID=Q726D1_NITV2|nr:hypothetical protein DVU_3260 [Nitratidesulfovibrio vulgaris str. Hildenborough]HBW15044.1 hypothetical protein [Desulfovibrio sp.]
MSEADVFRHHAPCTIPSWLSNLVECQTSGAWFAFRRNRGYAKGLPAADRWPRRRDTEKEVCDMQERLEELLRLAREMGLPVQPGAKVTDVVRLLNGNPDIAPDLVEALDAALNAALVPAPAQSDAR